MIRTLVLIGLVAAATPAVAGPPALATWLGAVTEDSLAEPGFFGRLVNIVAGSREEDRIALPFAVQVGSDDYLVLSRQTNNLVAIDRNTRSAKVLKIGGEGLLSPVAVVGTPDRYYISDPEQGTVFNGHNNHLEPFLTGADGLGRPTGLAWDRSRDRLWIVDTGNHRVFCFTTDGHRLYSLGGRGNADTCLNYPTFIAVTEEGAIIVNDTMNGRIKKWNADGSFAWSSTDFLTSDDPLGRAKGVATDHNGRIYVVDNMEDRVVVLDTDGTAIGSFGSPGNGSDQLWSPVGIAITGDTLVVADTQNHRLALFTLTGEATR